MNGVIEGLVGGSTQITIADRGCAVSIAMRQRDTVLEEVLTYDQAKRLQKLISNAAKRAFETEITRSPQSDTDMGTGLKIGAQ